VEACFFRLPTATARQGSCVFTNSVAKVIQAIDALWD
jgi:hypothetical protein